MHPNTTRLDRHDRTFLQLRFTLGTHRAQQIRQWISPQALYSNADHRWSCCTRVCEQIMEVRVQCHDHPPIITGDCEDRCIFC